MSLRLIDSTIVAILGAFEPLTAMVVGILILGDAWSMMSLCGAFLIFVAVAMLTVLPRYFDRARRLLHAA